MLIDLNPAEVKMIKDALIAMREGYKKNGFNALANFTALTLSKIRDAELDKATL